MEKVRILITGMGTAVGISIFKALKMSSLDTVIIGVDYAPFSAGLFRVDKAYLVKPAAYSPARFLDALLTICQKESIDLVFFGRETEMRLVAQVQEQFQRETGSKLLVNGPEVLRRTCDKWELVRFMQEQNLPVPASAIPEKEQLEELVRAHGFPLVVKPRSGSGSANVVVVWDKEQLRYVLNRISQPIVQQYLLPEDEEYTVGLFLPKPGECAGSIVMKRRLDGGVTSVAEVVEDKEIQELCTRTVVALGAVGPCNIQLRKTEEGPKIFDVNPRFSSSTVIRAYFGFNEPEMAIRCYVMNEEVKVGRIARGVALRYWHELYVKPEEMKKLLYQRQTTSPRSTVVDNF
ncbi:ATP-grasp domain-containing protein [Calderihabitans maritimus]|uniref:ATP-grasp domain-containing protein n=1 Tax=Calderihabitans maritimus TaxID=1246530 RepID=A0A1Z5HUS5_9FIRM|nr:ATP-grasp domain-containing protein [Calderihabitans maritimus]GAW93289.1 hypothetical protein Anae109_2623 [Calderihabitans maritimus]